MTWALIAGAVIGGASVYLKDKIADWTEGTGAEQYTSQWDNPTWSDYVAGTAQGMGGAWAIGGTAIQGIDDYNQDRENFDYRNYIAGAAGGYGQMAGWGKGTKMGVNQGIGMLPESGGDPRYQNMFSEQRGPSSLSVMDNTGTTTQELRERQTAKLLPTEKSDEDVKDAFAELLDQKKREEYEKDAWRSQIYEDIPWGSRSQYG